MNNNELSKETIDILYNILTSNLSNEEKAKQIVEKTDYQKISRYFYWNGKAKLHSNPQLETIRYNFKFLQSQGAFQKYELTYRCSFEEVDRRLKILNELNAMLKKDLTDREKLINILKNFKSYEDFRSRYSLMIKYGENDSRLNLGRESLNEFDRINAEVQNLFNDEQLLTNVQYEANLTKYLESTNDLINYKYAEWVIQKYLEYDRSYLKHELIEKLGIDLNRFNDCVKIVRLLNPKLYLEYKEKLSSNDDKRKRIIYESFQSIADAINNGVLYDGTPFDIIEFYKRLPMKRKGISAINDFLNHHMPNAYVYSTITHYMKQNHIRSIHYISEEQVLKRKCVITISGVLITPEIIHQVFDHMRVNNIPPIENVYEIILHKFARGEMNLDKFEEQEETKEKVKIYQNPYKFVPEKKI